MFWIAVLLLATLHFGLGLLFTLLAGLSNHSLLLAIAKVLIFPSEQFPAAIQDHAWLSYAAYALTCLAWSSLFCGLVRGAHALGGMTAGAAAAAALLLCLLGVIARLANPAPDWNSAGHRYLGDHYFLLPHPLQESVEERSAHAAIQQNLHPDAPYVPEPTGRWYWNYSATLSGFPEYDAVAIASPTTAVPSRAAFLEQVTAQRAQGWQSEAWEVVAESDRWTMESALPQRAPLPTSERSRLLRVVARQPAGGVWFALVAYERHMARERASGILERAMDSVRLMRGSDEDVSNESGSDWGQRMPAADLADGSVALLQLDLTRTRPSNHARPAWIATELWDRYRTDRVLDVPEPDAAVQAMAFLSADADRLSLFVLNAGEARQTLRVQPPDRAWKFTATGSFVEPTDAGPRQWILAPSMPLPLPRDFELDGATLRLLQFSALPVGARPSQ